MTTNRMGLEQLSDGELTVITDADHVQCGDSAAMARELLALRDIVRWRSVEEEMPPNETTVIVKNAAGTPWIADVDHDEFYPDEFPVDRMSRGEITHWMRFPQ